MAFYLLISSNEALRARNNIIAFNEAFLGGGVYHFTNDGIYEGNTFFRNFGQGQGGAMMLNASSVDVRDSILWENASPGGKEISIFAFSVLDMDYCDVEGGRRSVKDNGFSYGWGPGMIDVDPQFRDPSSEDLSLQETSPCIDVADPNSSLTGRDVMGVPRILDGDLDGMRALDMGAFEFSHVTLAVLGDATPGGAISVISDGTPGLQTFLFYGFSPSETELGPFGSLFIDLTAPWGLFPWLPLPSSVDGTIPSDFPAPATLILQELALDPSNRGNFSNDVVLVIE